MNLRIRETFVNIVFAVISITSKNAFNINADFAINKIVFLMRSKKYLSASMAIQMEYSAMRDSHCLRIVAYYRVDVEETLYAQNMEHALLLQNIRLSVYVTTVGHRFQIAKIVQMDLVYKRANATKMFPCKMVLIGN